MSARVLVVIRKEFREYRRNRFILLTMAGLPVVLLLILAAETFALPADVSDDALRRPVGEALLFLQLIPVMLPTTIAAYAVIGEREQRTLETVLSTPVTERELLAGKAIAAVLPAVAISWLLFGVYVGLADIFAPQVVVAQIWTVDQAVAMALLAPALAGFAIVVGILVSLRSSDFRVAQQLAVLASAPVIAFVALVTFRVLDPSVGLYAAAAAAVCVMNAACSGLGLHLFSRERLLTTRRTARARTSQIGGSSSSRIPGGRQFPQAAISENARAAGLPDRSYVSTVNESVNGPGLTLAVPPPPASSGKTLATAAQPTTLEIGASETT